MKFLILGLIISFHAFASSAQTNAQALQNIVIAVEQNDSPPTVSPDEAPAFEFKAVISHSTTMEDLVALKKKVSKRLGISIAFRQLNFDSTGLCFITLAATSKSRQFPEVRCLLRSGGEFGIYTIFYQSRRYIFIGNRSNWQLEFQQLLAKQSSSI